MTTFIKPNYHNNRAIDAGIMSGIGGAIALGSHYSDNPYISNFGKLIGSIGLLSGLSRLGYHTYKYVNQKDDRIEPKDYYAKSDLNSTTALGSLGGGVIGSMLLDDIPSKYASLLAGITSATIYANQSSKDYHKAQQLENKRKIEDYTKL